RQQFSFGFSTLEINDIFQDSKMNNLPTPLIAAAVFALLFVLERFFPLRNTTRSLVARLFVNLAISVFTFIAAGGAMGAAMVCGQTVRTRSCHRTAGAA